MGLLGGLVGGLAGFALGGPAGALTGASAGLSYGASKDAAKAQADAAASAAGVQRYMYDQTREDQAPYREAGTGAINQLSALGTGSPAEREAAMNQFYTDPGYQFRLGEGQRMLENSAAARGGLFSGNTGRALVDYGQGMGSQEYGNYWNRLSNLAGIGQTATNQLGTLGTGAAGRIGAANLAQGQARGSGYIGQADAFGSGMTGIGQAMGYGGGGSNWGSGFSWPSWGGAATNYNPPTAAAPNANPIYTPWGGR